MDFKVFLKKAITFFTIVTLEILTFSVFQTNAEESQEIFKYVLFAQETGNSIYIKAKSISMNGDVVTNGSFITDSDYKGINGTVYENQQNYMIDYQSVIENIYFSDKVNYIEYNYIPTEYNKNINISTFVEGEFNSFSNTAINNTALMSIDDIVVEANSFNSNNSVVYSQLGNIYINTDNFSASGLIYAPFGTVHIESANVNISGMIIAQNIEIVGDYNVNINKNESFMRTFGIGVTTQTYYEDEDILDIGDAYFKDITSEDDIVYAENGIYCVKNQFLLTADETVDFNDIAELVANYDASIVGYIELTNDYQVEFNNEIYVNDIRDIINELVEQPFIESTSLNIITEEYFEFNTNDTEWSSAWNEVSPSGTNWGIETIKLQSALINLGVISSSSSTSSDIDTSMLYNIKIGLIDSGFDKNHEDLNFTKVWNNFSDIDRLKRNGSHGTHVAGTMGAEFNNNIGITGICVKNRLYGFSTNGNTYTEISNKNEIFKTKFALALLIGNNVKVINRSLGNGNMAFYAAQGNSNALNYWNDITAEYDKFLCKLIDKGYDFLIVTSAGNSNSTLYYKDLNVSEAPYQYISVQEYNKYPSRYPSADTSVKYGASTSKADVILNDTDAKYDDQFQFSTNYKVKSRVISVGALSYDGDMCKSSCRGKRVDILAPGEDIYSCAITGTGVEGSNYYNSQGTSMAAPHVAGCLGLAYSINPAINATKLKSILISTASDFGIIVGTKNYKVVNAADLVLKTQDVLQRLTTSGNNTSTNEYNSIAIGLVIDEDNKPLSDVNVSVVLTSTNEPLNEKVVNVVTTDKYGAYEIVVPAGEYRLQFEKKQYLGEVVYYESTPEVITYIDTVKLYNESWTDNLFLTLNGKVTNAMNGENVMGAKIKFRRGWNNKTGNYVKTILGDKIAITNNQGEYLEMLSVGAYTVEISKEGFVTAYVNIIASPKGYIQYATITPILDEDEYRIILTWGDTPRDLDSHFIGNTDSISYHVYYMNPSYSYNETIIASLDLDCTGGYGPETITFTWTEKSGNCLYYVQDFTNRQKFSSLALSYSSAKVVVYKGNKLLATYNVPVGFNGTKWEVFKIIDGTLIAVNKVN